MILAVASGKGGTGKTTIAVNLALTLEATLHVQVLDCDVEEPDCHLFLRPTLDMAEGVTMPVPDIDSSRCNGCGRCAKVCAFHSIIMTGNQAITFPELCHGCGGCSLFCPTGAISEKPVEIGVIESGKAGRIGFVQGRLSVGSALAPPVIRAVRRKTMGDVKGWVTIIDAPPGTSCPVVNSVAGVDFCLLVTEPTPFGLNDLILAVGMVRQLGVPFGVVINRSGLGDLVSIKSYCQQEGIPILLEIPFDRRYAACYARGGRLVEEFAELKRAFKELWQKIEETLENERTKRTAGH
ncbi:MAG TPA: P-loop NTPase [Firmicutes bacterium]|nr:P-loop NTPase [Bacillota bacterium]